MPALSPTIALSANILVSRRSYYRSAAAVRFYYQWAQHQCQQTNRQIDRVRAGLPMARQGLYKNYCPVLCMSTVLAPTDGRRPSCVMIGCSPMIREDALRIAEQICCLNEPRSQERPEITLEMKGTRDGHGL